MMFRMWFGFASFVNRGFPRFCAGSFNFKIGLKNLEKIHNNAPA